MSLEIIACPIVSSPNVRPSRLFLDSRLILHAFRHRNSHVDRGPGLALCSLCGINGDKCGVGGHQAIVEGELLDLRRELFRRLREEAVRKLRPRTPPPGT